MHETGYHRNKKEKRKKRKRQSEGGREEGKWEEEEERMEKGGERVSLQVLPFLLILRLFPSLNVTISLKPKDFLSFCDSLWSNIGFRLLFFRDLNLFTLICCTKWNPIILLAFLPCSLLFLFFSFVLLEIFSIFYVDCLLH